jgi:hypothetical protein
MKIKIGISVLIALVMSSCAGFLDEDTRGRQEQSTFYTSEGLAFAGLTGLYQRIFTAQTFRENLSNRQDACSDLHTYKPVASADAYCFPRYTLTPEQVHVGNPWTGLYLAIFTANEFIRAMETNTVIDQAAREEFMREAKVIRAIMYYHLINRWGDVPMIMEPIEDTSVTDRARTPKAEIWQQLIVDLEDAAANLPAKGTARKGGGDGKAFGE